LVYFTETWHIVLWFCIFCCHFVYIFPVSVCCTKKNLTTLYVHNCLSIVMYRWTPDWSGYPNLPRGRATWWKKLSMVLIKSVDCFADNWFGREEPTAQDEHLAQLCLERRQSHVERGEIQVHVVIYRSRVAVSCCNLHTANSLSFHFAIIYSTLFAYSCWNNLQHTRCRFML
jgi:hypothetical protein